MMDSDPMKPWQLLFRRDNFPPWQRWPRNRGDRCRAASPIMMQHRGRITEIPVTVRIMIIRVMPVIRSSEFRALPQTRASHGDSYYGSLSSRQTPGPARAPVRVTGSS
jgi:hypothetical protein